MIEPRPGGAVAEPATDTRTETAPQDALLCAECRLVITTVAQRIERRGAHVHSRINPGGWVHTFGCYARAPGARPEGTPTEAFTWFEGFAWRLTACGKCSQHLGWCFSGEGDGFFGLILDRLVGG